ncbi:MAG: 2-hydroxyacid dehydrogenase [Clostridia bacterium]|nr:2-hydroxyacid dehydrogenase [Clostridia bacterium]
MKYVAVSDLYIQKEVFEECLAAYPDINYKIIHFGSDDRNTMREIFHTVERNGPKAWPAPEELYEAIEDADVLMVHTCPIPGELIRRGKKLRAILTCRGGLENIDVETATELNIPIINNPAHNSNSVAELAVGLMIDETRNISRSHMSLKQHQWREIFNNSGNIWELKRKTVGIVGFGNIGHLVAEKLNAFGCKLLVNDIRIDPEDEMLARLPIRVTDLPTLMKESDIVTLHARSEDLILSREMLSLMKPTAFFINTARAHMVDYNALYELLRDHRIMGAALEVHPTEPLPDDYPFLQLDNVTLTTHRGGDTINAFIDSPPMIMEDYQRYLAGKKPRFFANSEVGMGR